MEKQLSSLLYKKQKPNSRDNFINYLAGNKDQRNFTRLFLGKRVHDIDRDGVPDVFDCQPRNPKKDAPIVGGLVGSLISKITAPSKPSQPSTPSITPSPITGQKSSLPPALQKPVTTPISSGGAGASAGGTGGVTSTPSITTPSQPSIAPTAPSQPSPQVKENKVATYDSSLGGVVTSDGKFYPTSNPNWLPPGYSQGYGYTTQQGIGVGTSGGLATISPAQKALATKISEEIKLGKIQGFSGTTLTPQEIAKKQLLEQMKLIKPTQTYQEYYKGTTPESMALLKQYSEAERNRITLSPKEQFKAAMPEETRIIPIPTKAEIIKPIVKEVRTTSGKFVKGTGSLILLQNLQKYKYIMPAKLRSAVTREAIYLGGEKAENIRVATKGLVTFGPLFLPGGIFLTSAVGGAAGNLFDYGWKNSQTSITKQAEVKTPFKETFKEAGKEAIKGAATGAVFGFVGGAVERTLVSTGSMALARAGLIKPPKSLIGKVGFSIFKTVGAGTIVTGKATKTGIDIYFGQQIGKEVSQVGIALAENRPREAIIKSGGLAGSFIGFQSGSVIGTKAANIPRGLTGKYFKTTPEPVGSVKTEVPSVQIKQKTTPGTELIIYRRGPLSRELIPKADVMNPILEQPTKGTFFRTEPAIGIKGEKIRAIPSAPTFTSAPSFKDKFNYQLQVSKDKGLKGVKAAIDAYVNTPLLSDTLYVSKLTVQNNLPKQLTERAIREQATQGRLSKETQRELSKYSDSLISDKLRELGLPEEEILLRVPKTVGKFKVAFTEVPDNRNPGKFKVIPVVMDQGTGTRWNNIIRYLRKEKIITQQDAVAINARYNMQTNKEFGSKVVEPYAHTVEAHGQSVRRYTDKIIDNLETIDPKGYKSLIKSYGSKEKAKEVLANPALFHDLGKSIASSHESGRQHGEEMYKVLKSGLWQGPSISKAGAKAIRTHQTLQPIELGYMSKDYLGLISIEQKILATADRLDLTRFGEVVNPKLLPLPKAIDLVKNQNIENYKVNFISNLLRLRKSEKGTLNKNDIKEINNQWNKLDKEEIKKRLSSEIIEQEKVKDVVSQVGYNILSTGKKVESVIPTEVYSSGIVSQDVGSYLFPKAEASQSLDYQTYNISPTPSYYNPLVPTSYSTVSSYEPNIPKPRYVSNEIYPKPQQYKELPTYKQTKLSKVYEQPYKQPSRGTSYYPGEIIKQPRQEIVRFPTYFKPKEEVTGKRKAIVEIRRKGKFVQVSKPVEIEQAFGIGLQKVKSSLAASFRVREAGTGRVIRKAPGSISPQFRISKKEEGVIIQRTGFRLGSLFERKEITKAKQIAQLAAPRNF